MLNRSWRFVSDTVRLSGLSVYVDAKTTCSAAGIAVPTNVRPVISLIRQRVQATDFQCGNVTWALALSKMVYAL